MMKFPTRLLSLALLLFSALSVCAASRRTAPIRVACIGNSITYGYLLKDREREAYPAVLQQLLGSGYQVGNFGKSGATLLARGHRPYIQQEEYQRALDYRADIAVIHLGVNDTDPRNWPNYRDEFVPDYHRLIKALREANPRVRILIARTTPIGVEHPRFESGTRDWQDQIQKAIEQVAKGADVQLIDLHAPLYPYPHYLPDAVHPTAAGARIIAREVYGAITGDYGGLTLPEILSSGMVLQRRRPLELEGRANALEYVSLTFGGSTYTTRAGKDGRWSIILPPQEAGGPHRISLEARSRSYQLDSVYIGEVWLCSGQSNMAMMLRETADRDLADNAYDPELRIFDMKPAHTTDAVSWPISFLDSLNRLEYYLPTQWRGVTPEIARSTSAIAYQFARELRDSLHVPVGIIINAVGGAPTEAWIDRYTLEHEFPQILRHWRTNDFIMPWVRERASLNVKLQDTPLTRHPYAPTYLFDTGIRPLARFPIQGILWYQGESNAHNVEAHARLFPLLVTSWRQVFSFNIPFYYVQLSSMNRPSWPHFRESQRRLMRSAEGLEMVVSSDHGMLNDVHPRNKRPIAHRLALLALHNEYGYSSLTHRSPWLKALYREGNNLILLFGGTDELKTSDGQELRGFEVIGEDGLSYPMPPIKLRDARVIISLPRRISSQKLQIRYAWEPYTDANLVGHTGLPVSTFSIREGYLP